MKNKKVLCAMSGGVDSSVAAALLKKQGYEVYGITFKLFCYTETKQQEKTCLSSRRTGQDRLESARQACCFLESITDAKNICAKLNIPHYMVDVSKKFREEIIDNFISEYLGGRTPNPCIRCNSLIKFPALISYAKKLGIGHIATGHYARLQRANNKLQDTKYKLKKAKDIKKDQSYFLWGLRQNQLRHILFPVGNYKKNEIRNLAKKFNLKVAEKPESQEICFIDSNYSNFLKSEVNNNKLFKAGQILDTYGNKVGMHEGLPLYTIGQRKGLGGGYKKPMFVVNINIKENNLTIGEEKDLYSKKCQIKYVSFISKQKLPINIKCKARYNMKEAGARIKKNKSKFILEFNKPQRAITCGQSVVFYKADELLGGGIIDKII